MKVVFSLLIALVMSFSVFAQASEGENNEYLIVMKFNNQMYAAPYVAEGTVKTLDEKFTVTIKRQVILVKDLKGNLVSAGNILPVRNAVNTDYIARGGWFQEVDPKKINFEWYRKSLVKAKPIKTFGQQTVFYTVMSEAASFYEMQIEMEDTVASRLNRMGWFMNERALTLE